MAAQATVHVPVGHPPAVFCTPGNGELTQRIVRQLRWPNAKVDFRTFANGEISVKLQESVANKDVYVICSRGDPGVELNFMLMQLLMLLSALESEAAHRITVVLPCVEYARQDRKFEAGECIAPKLLLQLMSSAGASRFVTMDMHNPAEAGFSPAEASLDELCCEKYLASFIRENVPSFMPENTLVCAVDAGGAKQTRRMADELQVGFMMADKFRVNLGEMVEVRIISDASSAPENVVIVDDMFDTCGSLVKVVEAVRKFAPKAKLFAAASHGYFSKDAHEKVKRMVDDAGLQWIAVTNSLSQESTLQNFTSIGIHEQLRIIDISRLVAGAIIRLHLGTSVNLARFRDMGPEDDDFLLQEAHLVPTKQHTLRGVSRPCGSTAEQHPVS